jgi:hypothetical protein
VSRRAGPTPKQRELLVALQEDRPTVVYGPQYRAALALRRLGYARTAQTAHHYLRTRAGSRWLLQETLAELERA